MDGEIYLLVTGLADDHAAARDALVAVVESEVPGAVVLDPSAPPAEGFEVAVVVPGPLTAAITEQDGAADGEVCSRLRHRLGEELREREVMFAKLEVAPLG